MVYLPDISIHAPVKGATGSRPRSSSWSTNFNPRSREESDAIRPGEQPLRRISIHAPVKGATDDDYSDAGSYSNFNPRSREGSD